MKENEEKLGMKKKMRKIVFKQHTTAAGLPIVIRRQ